jgi:hypothetical protein
MIIEGNDKLQNVYGLTKADEEKILVFLKGAVYCWCKNTPQKSFSLREMLGGKNIGWLDWKDTPLKALLDKHKDKENTNQAEIDAGWLLKKVVSDMSKAKFKVIPQQSDSEPDGMYMANSYILITNQ